MRVINLSARARSWWQWATCWITVQSAPLLIESFHPASENLIIMQNQISGFPLSLQQRQLWRFRNESTAFRAQCVVLLKGNLNKKILAETLNEVVKRHEILRTTFRQIPSLKYPIQVITEDCSIELKEIDLTSLVSHERIEEVIRQQRNLSFDYERGPLLHLSLLALAPDEHMLALTLPAFCADAQTLDNLVS